MTIYENKDMLIEYFERIEENSHQTNFYKVMPHVNILYDSLQSRNVTPDLAKKCVDSFLEEMKKIRIILDSMDVQETESERNRPKRTKRDPVPKTIAAKEVCVVISNQALDRFQFNGHLILAKLFNFHSFPVFQENFPQTELDNVCALFPFLEKSRLKLELLILYGRNDFKNVKKTGK